MNSKLFILIFSYYILLTTTLKLQNFRNSLSALSHSTTCGYYNCSNPKYIINRATNFYLGLGSEYNSDGFDAVLDYKYEKFCIGKCHITNVKTSLVLDVAESDLALKHIIFWPLHEYRTGNQVWVVKKESNGFSSILTMTNHSKLALSSVDTEDASKGLTLTEFDIDDKKQQWIIQE